MTDALLREIEMQKGRSEDLSRKLDAERALADDLAEAINRVYSSGWLVMPPQVVQALAHYREARA